MLSKLSPRAYYLHERNAYNFPEIIHSILVQHISVNNNIENRPNKYDQREEIITYTDSSSFLFYTPDTYHSYFVTNEDSYNFVTCAGFNRRTTLKVFIQAFHTELWILLLIELIFIILILLVATAWYSAVKCTNLSSVAFYSLSVLLENWFGKLKVFQLNRFIKQIFLYFTQYFLTYTW